MNSWVTFHFPNEYQIVPWKLSPPFNKIESGVAFLSDIIWWWSLEIPPMHSDPVLHDPPASFVSSNLKNMIVLSVETNYWYFHIVTKNNARNVNCNFDTHRCHFRYLVIWNLNNLRPTMKLTMNARTERVYRELTTSVYILHTSTFDSQSLWKVS